MILGLRLENGVVRRDANNIQWNNFWHLNHSINVEFILMLNNNMLIIYLLNFTCFGGISGLRKITFFVADLIFFMGILRCPTELNVRSAMLVWWKNVFVIIIIKNKCPEWVLLNKTYQFFLLLVLGTFWLGYVLVLYILTETIYKLKVRNF